MNINIDTHTIIILYCLVNEKSIVQLNELVTDSGRGQHTEVGEEEVYVLWRCVVYVRVGVGVRVHSSVLGRGGRQ